MKIGIMQPYFFPYLGYISLLKHTDKFILFDTVQFMRHSWIERNRILKPDDGWQYIQVPLIKFPRATLIKDVEINNSINWRNKILAQLQHYKKSAPYYSEIVSLLNGIFDTNYTDMVSLNKKALEEVCVYLGINKKVEVFSEMNLNIGEVFAPDEWALSICNAIKGVDEYWNPPGGRTFFDSSKYDSANIKLKFHSINITKYTQKSNSFEPALSIIDVMMFNSVVEINHMLDNYEFL